MPSAHASGDSTDLELATNLITRVNVGDSLTRTAARLPQAFAVVDGARRWTYTELNQRVNRVANSLLSLGYRRGDALALGSGNSCELLVTYYACAKLGVVCVPLNLGWRADEIAYVLDHSRSCGIVVEAQLVAQVLPGVERVPAVHDVVVAHGTDGQYEQALPTAAGARSPTCTTHPATSPRCTSTSGTRSATSTPAARRRSPRALSAATSRCTSSRSP